VYTLVFTRQFKRDYGRYSRSGQGVEDIDAFIRLLASGQVLSPRYRDHALKGEYRTFRECHVRPDLLIIYRFDGSRLMLVRLGSHAELFE
jgi:mRNA interferase YafQ